jgi:hypothetical protein
MHTKFWWRDLRKAFFVDLGIDGRIAKTGSYRSRINGMD